MGHVVLGTAFSCSPYAHQSSHPAAFCALVLRVRHTFVCKPNNNCRIPSTTAACWWCWVAPNGPGRQTCLASACVAHDWTTFTKKNAFVALHTIWWRSRMSRTRPKCFDRALINLSSDMSSVQDPMMMSSTNGSAQSRTRPSRSSIMRWNTALPFFAPIGTSLRCVGPSGVLMAVHALESLCSGIW